MSEHPKHIDGRHGARQEERFNPERAAKLDDPARFEYLPVQEVARLLDVPAGGLTRAALPVHVGKSFFSPPQVERKTRVTEQIQPGC